MKKKGKLFRWYVGVYADERDEYQLSKIYEVLARNNMWTLLLTSIFMMASFIWDTVQQQFSLGTILLFVLLQFNSLYAVQKLWDNKLTNREVYTKEEYRQLVKKLRLQNSMIGLSFGGLMYLWMEYVFPFLLGEPLSFNWVKLIIWFVAGIFFGVTMYAVGKSQVKLVEEDE